MASTRARHTGSVGSILVFIGLLCLSPVYGKMYHSSPVEFKKPVVVGSASTKQLFSPTIQVNNALHGGTGPGVVVDNNGITAQSLNVENGAVTQGGKSLEIGVELTVGDVGISAANDSTIVLDGNVKTTGHLNTDPSMAQGIGMTRAGDTCSTAGTGWLGGPAAAFYDDGSNSALHAVTSCGGSTLGTIDGRDLYIEQGILSDTGNTLELERTGGGALSVSQGGTSVLQSAGNGWLVPGDVTIDGTLQSQAGNLEIAATSAASVKLKSGGVDIVSAGTSGVTFHKMVHLPDPGTARPACDASNRGVIWVQYGGAGVADTIAICQRNAADTYIWAPFAPDILGPTGPVGDKGQKGQTGPGGDKGFKGQKGQKGITGPVGPTGSIGLKGINGPVGDKGNIGPTGPTGPVGQKGQTGAGGGSAVGPQGTAGDNGVANLNTCTDGVMTTETEVQFGTAGLRSNGARVQLTGGCGSSSLMRLAVDSLWVAGEISQPCKAGYTPLLGGKMCMGTLKTNTGLTYDKANADCRADNAILCPFRAFLAACATHTITWDDGTTTTTGGFNPYGGVQPGLYGERAADDLYHTWNFGSCTTNNDGSPISRHSGLTGTWSYRCCYGRLEM